jgi:hypothetical protein
MIERKSDFNILESIERHIGDLKPLLPKQAVVCVGEYPIKTMLKTPAAALDGLLPIFIEKSSDDIYKWLPKGYTPHLVVGFEDSGVDTHFWYDVLPPMIRSRMVIDSIHERSAEKLRGAVIFTSAWDGVGSAAVPSFTEKFAKAGVDSLSIAILPSQIQPADAHFNAYAMMQLALQTEGSTVLLLGRDQLETFEGVDRKGEPLKGNSIVNYLFDLFLSKELLVQEISELSRTFNIKLFSALAVTAASYKVYGSVENMLNTALLKPLMNFDIASASLLYVLIRMPATLNDKVPKAKIDLAITNWFKNKTSPQSIHISEPIYTQDMTDRIDAVLFIGGFDTAKMFAELELKVSAIKTSAVERDLMTQDWQLPYKVEEDPPKIEEPQVIEPPKPEEPQITGAPEPIGQPIAGLLAPEPVQPVELPVPAIEEPQAIHETPTAAPPEATFVSMEQPLQAPDVLETSPVAVAEPVSGKTQKPKRKPRAKKADPTQSTELSKPKRKSKAKLKTETKAE